MNNIFLFIIQAGLFWSIVVVANLWHDSVTMHAPGGYLLGCKYSHPSTRRLVCVLKCTGALYWSSLFTAKIWKGVPFAPWSSHINCVALQYRLQLITSCAQSKVFVHLNHGFKASREGKRVNEGGIVA